MVEEILFIAPTKGYGGYVTHSVGILKELYKRVTVQHIPLVYNIDEDVHSEEIKKIIDETVNNKVSEFSPVIWLTLPSNVKLIPHRTNINITTFESDRICSDWVMVGRAVDLTLVTNDFLKRVWIDSGVPEEKVEVLEEGTDLAVFNPNIEPLELFYRGKPIGEIFEHRFMLVAELSHRKNVRDAVVAFKKAFSGRKDVCLILKIGYMDVDKDIDYFLRGIDLRDVFVFVFDQTLPYDLVPRFFQNATCYYSLSCGEGWDLNCVSFGAMKKPVIVPYHTAYRHYLNKDRGFLVEKYEKTPAKQYNVLDRFFEGSNWFKPDIDEAVDVLRYFVECKAEERMQKVEDFYNYIKENLTWERIGDKLIEILNSRF